MKIPALNGRQTARWSADVPRVGIRPAIDGRRSDGCPVECVVGDTCIRGVAEDAACATLGARYG